MNLLKKTGYRKTAVAIICLLTALLSVDFFSGQGPTVAAQDGTNLLQNPDFAQPYTNGVANGWSAWHRESAKTENCAIPYWFRPQWNAETITPIHIFRGNSSQFIGNSWDTWMAGVYQTVPATPGQTYRFSFHAKGRTANEPGIDGSLNYVALNIRAGIDPTGGTTWHGGSVVWGPAGSPHDNWQQFSVEVTAVSNQITVFTSANLTQEGVNQCLPHLDTWYDAAELVVVQVPTNTPPPPPPPPPATNTPVNTPTPEVTNTPTAVPTNTPTPTPTTPPGGTICLNAFNDENANGIHDPGEDYLAGITFTVSRDGELVDTAISTGRAEPICFEGLAPGAYQVAQQIPPRLELTTADTAVIEINEGQTLGLEFGSRLRPPATPVTAPPGADTIADVAQPPTPEPETAPETAEPTPDTAPRSLAALSGLIALFLGVVLLSVLLFVFLRRQTT